MKNFEKELTRREMIRITALSSLAWSALSPTTQAQSVIGTAQAAKTVAKGERLRRIGEIKSKRGKLRGTIRITNQVRRIPYPGGSDVMLRYYEGSDDSGVIWPPKSDPKSAAPYLPGPTIRARIGDTVNLVLVNNVDPSKFPNSLDTGAGEAHATPSGCDVVKIPPDPVPQYPDQVGDTYPNCFHASSTTNLHFHGTHVSPRGIADNIFLQIRSDKNVSATNPIVKRALDEVFAAPPPQTYAQMPDRWKAYQASAITKYNKTAPYNGQTGLPPDLALPVPSLTQTEFPEWVIGVYPYNFLITPPPLPGNSYKMGQAPGTHWYHAHKHGSTATNVYNGLAGAFIIEGQYDDDLEKIYPDLKKTEKVLVVLEPAAVPALETTEAKDFSSLLQTPPVVNGSVNPIIDMRPGEIQLWRFVSAGVGAGGWLLKGSNWSPSVTVKQIAQDGVQFSYENYQDQPLLENNDTFASGNRVDWLVQAPGKAGDYTLFSDNAPHTVPLLTLRVAGTAINPAPQFPTQDNYPHFPDFLKDIKDSELTPPGRTVEFNFVNGNFPTAPHFTIDGKQFSEDPQDFIKVNLGQIQEWTVTNPKANPPIPHPFHIHVNPFQVVEISDGKTTTRFPEGKRTWWDTRIIPPGGYIKIRSRFVDFWGEYVLHCHILDHEDRGMMKVVAVEDPPAHLFTTAVHHH